MIALDGLLEFTHLFGGNIAGNIPALFIALVVVVGPFGTLAYHAQSASVQALDLGNFVENRLGSRFCAHRGVVYVLHIYIATKKGRKTEFEDFCLTPPTRSPDVLETPHEK